MGWCRELIEFSESHEIEPKKILMTTKILAEMADEAYERDSSHWEDKRDKAECYIYGWHFTKEGAEKAVARMKNKDGSSGAYWSLQDVESVVVTMQIDWNKKRYNLYDLYYTLNMVRSDYYKSDAAPQYYVDLAFDFLEDKDAPEGKAKRYYVCMHTED